MFVEKMLNTQRSLAERWDRAMARRQQGQMAQIIGLPKGEAVRHTPVVPMMTVVGWKRKLVGHACLHCEAIYTPSMKPSVPGTKAHALRLEVAGELRRHLMEAIA